jgi:hypothetical protein
VRSDHPPHRRGTSGGDDGTRTHDPLLAKQNLGGSEPICLVVNGPQLHRSVAVFTPAIPQVSRGSAVLTGADPLHR